MNITSPANGATVKGTVSITVDAPGTKRVNFWIDGALAPGGQDFSAPFVYSWDTTKYTNGNHKIKAIAGNGKSSAWITVTVKNAVVPPPSPKVTNGVLMYAGNLSECSHLSDNTYTLAIASWKDPALLSVSGEAYNYTVMKGTEGWDNPGQIAFDPEDTSGWLAQVSSLAPGQHVFIDNFIYGMVDIPTLAAVSVKLRAAGRKLAVNCNRAYVASVDDLVQFYNSTLWQQWAQQIEPYVDRILLEHWQAVNYFEDVPTGDHVRYTGTDAWWKWWQGWQNAPAVCNGKFVGMIYGSVFNAVYAKASLALTGAKGVIIYNNGDGEYNIGTDPYDVRVLAAATSPAVDSTAPDLSATLDGVNKYTSTAYVNPPTVVRPNP